MSAQTDSRRNIVPAVEKIGLALAMLIAVILVGISVFSLLIDLVLKFNTYGIVVDLIVLSTGILLAYFAIRIYKKSAYYESLVNTAFDKGIYTRLEPILRKIAETHVEMESLEGRLGKIDRMVQTLMDEQLEKEQSHVDESISVAHGTSVAFIAKVILLTVVSLAAFITMVETSFEMAHFATLFLFVLWWWLISSEFNVFDNNTAWVALFLPILLVPFSFLFLNIAGILALNDLLGIFYTILALYAFLYYSWAVYKTRGTLPLSLDHIRKVRHK